jgi:hypothetical protein
VVAWIAGENTGSVRAFPGARAGEKKEEKAKVDLRFPAGTMETKPLR